MSYYNLDNTILNNNVKQKKIENPKRFKPKVVTGLIISEKIL